jgi:fructose-1,6-bisphosphatase
MPYRRTTLSKFLIEDQRRSPDPQPALASLLNDVQTACKLIAVTVAGIASHPAMASSRQKASGDEDKPLKLVANTIMTETCEWGGQLAGMISAEMDAVYHVPAIYPRGRYLMAFAPLDGAANADVNVAMGTIFSVLQCPEGVSEPEPKHFLQPGVRQVAAGYALYGPAALMVITTGAGVHGFTLDREIGAFILTHPDMTIPPATREFAINISNHSLWEQPVRRYVDECIAGATGPRGAEFNMRWVATMTADIHRLLLRGGIYMYPAGSKDPGHRCRVRLLYEANPIAMLVEQAGGMASTGHERILDVSPTGLHQRVPVILGSREEVARIERYYQEYARGENSTFSMPLFNTRSLFRTT